MSRAPSRRAALAASSASPDAALLILCDRFFTIHVEAEAATTDAALGAAHRRRWATSGEIETTLAHTPSGKMAKARVALHMLQECGDTPRPGSWERLVLVALAEAAGLPIPPVPAEVDDGRPAPAPAVFSDAELLAACAGADEVQRRRDALYYGPGRIEDDDERDALEEPLRAEQEPLLEQVCDLEAQTLAGHVARARTLTLWDKEVLNRGGGAWNELLVTALARDLVARAQA